MNISISSRPLHDWDALVQPDRAHRILYTDPAVFQEEMTKVFGAVWVYLGHESQIPNNDDFIATKLGYGGISGFDVRSFVVATLGAIVFLLALRVLRGGK